MTQTPVTAKDYAEIEELLPWYATGSLSEEDRRLVENALENDDTLVMRLELVREEMVETTSANEQLNSPGADTFAKMMDMIDAEPAPPRSLRSTLRGFLASVDDLFTDLAPATVRMGAALAAIVIVAQGIIIGSSYMGRDTTRYQTASGGGPVVSWEGTYALVKFSGKARAGDIARYLSGLNASIVDGPKPGGLYRVKLSGKTLSAEQREKLIAALGKNTSLIELVLPAGNSE